MHDLKQNLDKGGTTVTDVRLGARRRRLVAVALVLAALAGSVFWLRELWHSSAARTAYLLIRSVQEHQATAFFEQVDLDTLVADSLAQLNTGKGERGEQQLGGLVSGILTMMNGPIVGLVQHQLQGVIERGVLLGETSPPEGSGVLGQVVAQSRFALPFFQRRGAPWLAAVFVAEGQETHGDTVVVELPFRLPGERELLRLKLEFCAKDGVMRLTRLPNLFAVLDAMTKNGHAEFAL